MVQGNFRNRKPVMPLRLALGIGVTSALLLLGPVSEGLAQSGAAQATGDYPDVNKVPQSAPPSPTVDDMKRATEGLAGDSARANYGRQSAQPASVDPSGLPKARYGRVGGTTRVPTTDIRDPAPTSAPTTAVATEAVTPAPRTTAQPATESAQPRYGRASTARTQPQEVASPGGTPPATSAPATEPRPVVASGQGGATASPAASAPGAVSQAPIYAPAVPAISAPAFTAVVIDSTGERAANPNQMGYLMGTPVGYTPTFMPTSSILVGEIYFASSSSNIDGRDMQVLQDIANYQRMNGGYLRVVGHSSSRTGDMTADRHDYVNLQMSAKRADAVQRVLTRLGVPQEAVYMNAESDRMPVFMEVMPAGEAFNRRVEIYLEY